MTLQLNAYAKINLFLDVTSRRSDGYHNILSLMQSVELSDTVSITVDGHEEPGIVLQCDRPELPTDRRNLAYRAAEAFYAALGKKQHTLIAIKKRIPVSAGLAGGSTDAATVLVGLNRIFGAPFSVSELCVIGKTLGADVPFCIIGGTAEIKGIGDDILSLPDLPPLTMVIAKKGEGVSTPKAYGALDEAFDFFSGTSSKQCWKYQTCQ